MFQNLPERQSSRPYRHRKTFLRLVSITISIALVLCLLLSYLSALVMTENIAERQLNIYSINLSSNIQAIDSLMETIEQSLLHLTFSENLIQLCFQEKANTGVYNKVVLDAASLASHNNMISGLCIYVPHLDVVLTDRYFIKPLAESEYHPIIVEYLNETSASSQIVYGTQLATLLYHEGSLILIRDFPLSSMPEYARATVFCVINQDKLFKQLEIDDIAVLNSSGSLLAGSPPETHLLEALMEDTGDLDSEALRSRQAEGHNYVEYGDLTMFYNRSNITGWVFLNTTDSKNIWQPLSQTLLDLAPQVLMIFLVLIAVCFYVSNVVIRPLDESISALEHSLPNTQSDLQHRDEFEFLKFYTSTVNSAHSDMQNLIHSVSDDVNRRLFSEILSGTQYTLGDITQLLTDTQSRFRPDDYFVVGILSDNLTRREVREYMIRYCSQYPYMESQVLPTREFNNVVILAFRGDMSLIKMRMHIRDLHEGICRQLSTGGQEVSCTFGYIYRTMLDLLPSYRSAQELLRKMQESEAFPAEEEVPSQTPPPGYAPALTSHIRFNGYADQILAYIQEGDMENTDILCSRIIQNISDLGNPEDYSAFFSAIADRITQLEFLQLELLPNFQFDRLVTSANEAERSSVLRHHAEEVKDGLIALLRSRQEALSNRYIISTREYVAEHYSNGDLSLNDAAEFANVSPSYLSRVFKQNLHTTFTEYLNSYRIRQSIVLLESNIPVKDIAAQCGFNSVQHYIRVFKKMKNQSPGQFREHLNT